MSKFAWLILALLWAPLTTFAETPQADPALQKTFEKMLAAIKDGDRDAFVADGSEAVKKGTTAQVIKVLKDTVGGRLQSGYTATYLCSLKQAGHQVNLWKLSFKDDDDDLVVRIAMKDGKVGGFFFQ